jgi:hypothetical protein
MPRALRRLDGTGHDGLPGRPDLVPPSPSPEEIAQQRAADYRRQLRATALQLNDQGVAAVRGGDWDGAASDFTQALQSRPDDATIRHNLDIVRQHEEAGASISSRSQGDLSALDEVRRDALNRQTARALDGIFVPSPLMTVVRQASPPGPPELTAADAMVMSKKVQSIRAELVRIDRSMQEDNSPRAEARAEDDEAAANLVIVTTGGILDLVGAHAESDSSAAEAELTRSVDMLSSETDAGRRERLMLAFRALRHRRDGLQSLTASIGHYQDAYKAAVVATEADKARQVPSWGNRFEAVWAAAELLKLVPPQEAKLKAVLDAAYDFAVIYENAGQADVADANDERELVALRQMKRAMERAVQDKQ